MRLIISAVLVSLMLTACGPATLDASSESALKASATKIVNELKTPEERQEFARALEYFAVGGRQALTESIERQVLSEDDSTAYPLMENGIKLINGLSGLEIITRFRNEISFEMHKMELVKQAYLLEKEAYELMELKDFKEARANFAQIKELGVEADMVSHGFEMVAKAEADYKKMQAYIPFIKVTACEARHIDSYMGKKIAGLRFSVKNTGSLDIDRIEVMVKFLNARGDIVAEESLVPVNSFGVKSRQLGAGRILDMKRGFYFTVDKPLANWQEGNVRIEVKDIKFAEHETSKDAV